MKSPEIPVSSAQKDNSLGDSYLKFRLNSQTLAVLSIKQTQEGIVVPVEAITSIPNMPDSVLGLMNWRSRILWVVDLSVMLNLESFNPRLRQYNVIIIKVESVLLGLVVQEITGTTKFRQNQICSPVGQVASSLVPYLQGCIIQQEEITLVLDAQAIVQSSVLGID
ncbi:MAG: chemotaxis protein CheW [Nostocaceae cyanobacterium]|nr:chemotaxis protein CheW [Nostocaceae cyanobacterium]